MAEGNGKPPVDAELDIPDAATASANRLAAKGVTHDPGGWIELSDRIIALERHYGDINTAFGQLRAYALSLGKQEDYQKTVMERNIRAAAADLAIKSATDETKADAGALTTMAGAWLVWLKGGDQAG